MKANIKAYFLSFLFFGINFISLAGSDLDKSLREALNFNTQVAQKLLSINYEKAIKTADSNLLISRKINYRNAIILNEVVKNTVFLNTNKAKDAINNSKELLDTYNSELTATETSLLFEVIAAAFFIQNSYDSSQYYNEKALAIYIKNKSYKQAYAVKNALCRIFLKKGETEKAKQFSIKAQVGFELIKDKHGIATSFDIVGEIIYAQRLFEQSIPYFTESLNRFIPLSDNAGTALASIHLGNAYFMLAKDDSSQLHYENAMLRFNRLGDMNGVASSLSNLSRIYLEKGDTKLALDFANKAIKLAEHSDNKLIEISTLQHLSDIYIQLEDFNKAIFYINLALEKSSKINNKQIQFNCFKTLSELHASLKNPNKAYDALLNAYHIKDSLQPLAYSQKIAELDATYQKEKNENNLNALKQKNTIEKLILSNNNKKLKTKNIFLISISVIFLLIAIALYFHEQKIILKKDLDKRIAIQETQETERLRFAKDIHDDLGSDLSKINLISEMIVNRYFDINEIKNSAQVISETAKSVVENMRELIWALNPQNTTLENLIIQLREFASDYLDEYQAEIKLQFPEFVPVLFISKQAHREIVLTFKECLNNILKHSLASKIEIFCDLDLHTIYLSIKDNGVGFDISNSKKGNGIRNIRERISNIYGVSNFNSSPSLGTQINIQIPILNLTNFTTKV